MNDVFSNIQIIKDRIAVAEKTAGRKLGSVKLIAVSKRKPVEDILKITDNSVYALGENRVQELCDKFDVLKHNYDIHFIGHLQKNKVKHIIDKISMLHTLDSLALVAELSKRLANKNKILDILIQVNTSGEEQKSGVGVDEISEFIEKILIEKNIRLCGFMSIGRFSTNKLEVRKEFKMLKDLFDKTKQKFNLGDEFRELSMGMTGDFEDAILEGSTMVRVGSAIFGARS